MKRFLIITLVTAAFASAVLLTLFVKTTTANADIAAGNQAYAAQDYETALQRYTAAQAQARGQVEPAYNAANTYYRQNVPDQARQILEQTLTQPHNAIAEFVHFNLGNIAFNTQQFDAAIAHYEEALRLQPDDQAAKHNLELALLQQRNQDQQNQQDQQQNQDQQNQQDQQQNQPNQDQQNQQNQSSDQQKPSGGQQDQQDGQQGDQQDQQQGQQGDQQDQQQDQQGNQQDQQQGQQAGQPDQPQPDQQNGQAHGARPQQGLTPEQAKRLLAVIGGNSKTLMEKLQLMYIVPGGNPDKDW